jgi:hypothetical protein
MLKSSPETFDTSKFVFVPRIGFISTEFNLEDKTKELSVLSVLLDEFVSVPTSRWMFGVSSAPGAEAEVLETGW